MKKICIVGAGAIGGFIGARLASKGECQVSALARGSTLTALRAHGWRLKMGEQLISAPAKASDDAHSLGPQDAIVVAVKAPALEGVAAQLGPLMHENTVVVPAMNGVPWWFCASDINGPKLSLRSVDPNGNIADAISLQRVVGCVVHASTLTPEPGLVQHKMGQGLILGEPVGGGSERVEALGALLKSAGFEVTLSNNIRYDIWYKLWGNMTMNPISAITGATVDKLLADPLVRNFCSAAMTEASAVGAAIGCPIAQSAEDRHQITAKLGAFKTSMLQDVNAARAIELDALVSVVREIGEAHNIKTPAIDALLGMTRVFARERGLYPAA